MREPITAIVRTPTAEATRVVGSQLGEAIKQHRNGCLVVTLAGDLGAGKTTFVGGVLRAFGFDGPVRSPTYTLIEPYDLDGRQLYHLDLYRLANAAEVEGLALRDLLMPGSVLMVEWPERAVGQLPPPDVEVQFYYQGSGRELRFAACQATLLEGISSSGA